jgi:predicted dienelactone hydrolase
VLAKTATSTSLRSTIDEFLQAGASEREAASLTGFGDKPLVVLTAGSGSDSAWMAAQDKTAALSTNSAHRVVDGATHPDLILKQADAAVTAQAIIDVVSSVRSNQPLGK